MIQQFVDREPELKFLEKKYSEATPQLIIIYGRRRTGKTELIKRFIQNKTAIYVLCTKDSMAENLKDMKRKLHGITGKEYFLKLDTGSFFDLFRYMLEEIGNKKVVIALDEFPYLIELERGVVSTFQKICDELLKDRKVFLLLCGSSIGMMETEVLGTTSPLYGRRTGEWKVEPFRFRNLREMLGKFSIEELVKAWCVFGGTPFYLSQIDPKMTVAENIKRKILAKGEILYNEPRILLREEFREPKTYMLILKYMSLGCGSQGELSSMTGIEKGNLSKYLSVLEETQLIRYVLPLGQRKRGIYVISDPFFNFWFRFAYPNLSDLEIGLVDEVFARTKAQLNAYYGTMFEHLTMELVKSKDVPMPFGFSWAGRWWHKDKEIDLVALNEGTKEILFGECKWQDGADARKIAGKLREKSKFVGWNADGRKEYYAVFAKSFREKIKEPGLFLFDLKDIERALLAHGKKAGKASDWAGERLESQPKYERRTRVI
jgi:hypothetical protein